MLLTDVMRWSVLLCDVYGRLLLRVVGAWLAVAWWGVMCDVVRRSAVWRGKVVVCAATRVMLSTNIAALFSAAVRCAALACVGVRIAETRRGTRSRLLVRSGASRCALLRSVAWFSQDAILPR